MNPKRWYTIVISVGGGKFRPTVGWEAAYDTLAEAKRAAIRAEQNDGWRAKVVSATPEEATAFGWRAPAEVKAEGGGR